MKMFKRIRKAVKAIRKYIKYGENIVNLSVAQVQYPEILKGKKIVVTGGSDGIGLAMAKKFLSVGAEVMITGRNLDKLHKVAAELNNQNLYVLQWDISDMSCLSANIDRAIADLGGLDVFVNNAAFIEHIQKDEAFYDKTMDTNLKAPYFICQRVVDYFLKCKAGCCCKIINITSINAFQGSEHPYFISKWGLTAYTKGLAMKYADRNIIVNAIAPGICASSINYQDYTQNAYYQGAKNKRIVIPEEIAEIALFLCSDAANGIIGQTIVCDGGRLLQ